VTNQFLLRQWQHAQQNQKYKPETVTITMLKGNQKNY